MKEYLACDRTNVWFALHSRKETKGTMPTEIAEGQSGLATIVIRFGATAMAQVYPRGATITRWVTAQGVEALYLSPQTDYGVGKAIRGGIPVCWPQFADLGPLPKHGLLRTLDEWQLAEVVDDTSSCTVTFRIRWSGESEASDHPFKDCLMSVAYVVKLTANSLETTLVVDNDGSKPFSCTGALHSYFSVSDISNIRIESELADVEYRDSLKRRELQSKAPLERIDQEVDRVYVNYFSSPDRKVTLLDDGNHTAIEIRVTEGFREVVMWNAWIEKAKTLTDMPDDDYKRYVCVEPAVIEHAVVIEPGQRWTGGQLLTVTKQLGKI